MKPDPFYFFQSPVLRHIRRLFFSSLLYGSIIALLVAAPIQAIKLISFQFSFGPEACLLLCCLLHFPLTCVSQVYPSFLPFNIWFRDPIYEGPIDLLMVHIAVPFTLEYVHPKTNLKVCWISTLYALYNYITQRMMGICLHKAGDVLSLSSYLFPSFDPATNQENPVVYPNHFALRVHIPLPFIERIALTSGTRLSHS
mgnify:CR=1 FL=1